MKSCAQFASIMLLCSAMAMPVEAFIFTGGVVRDKLARAQQLAQKLRSEMFFEEMSLQEQRNLLSRTDMAEATRETHLAAQQQASAMDEMNVSTEVNLAQAERLATDPTICARLAQAEAMRQAHVSGAEHYSAERIAPVSPLTKALFGGDDSRVMDLQEEGGFLEEREKAMEMPLLGGHQETALSNMAPNDAMAQAELNILALTPMPALPKRAEEDNAYAALELAEVLRMQMARTALGRLAGQRHADLTAQKKAQHQAHFANLSANTDLSGWTAKRAEVGTLAEKVDLQIASFESALARESVQATVLLRRLAAQ